LEVCDIAGGSLTLAVTSLLVTTVFAKPFVVTMGSEA
jgi:hypothetical protein|tara:strand:- start:507 stop:617 length:111 start_codon:yes stop_codon:yes gene_type:complete